MRIIGFAFVASGSIPGKSGVLSLMRIPSAAEILGFAPGNISKQALKKNL